MKNGKGNTVSLHERDEQLPEGFSFDLNVASLPPILFAGQMCTQLHHTRRDHGMRRILGKSEAWANAKQLRKRNALQRVSLFVSFLCTARICTLWFSQPGLSEFPNTWESSSQSMAPLSFPESMLHQEKSSGLRLMDTGRSTAALLFGEPADQILHVLVAWQPPCSNSSVRETLAKKMIRRLESQSPHVAVYLVELVPYLAGFSVTKANCSAHLQIQLDSTAPRFWYKENLLNIGVERLLPLNWKAVAWVDSDVEFDNPLWAFHALKLLNGVKDAVQLFSHAIFLDEKNHTERTFTGYAYNFVHGLQYEGYGNDLWHPGFGWAYSRQAFDQMGGFYEREISGLGDGIMAHSLRGGFDWSTYGMGFSSDGHYREILAYNDSCRNLKMGYVPGILKHYFHGPFTSRNYGDRRRNFNEHKFDPRRHLERETNTGLLKASDSFPFDLLQTLQQQAC
jgi:hypothetical protein